MAEIGNPSPCPDREQPSDETIRRQAISGDLPGAISLYAKAHHVNYGVASNAVRDMAGLPHLRPIPANPVLSPKTQQWVEVLFPPEHRDEVTSTLGSGCGNNLWGKSDEFGMERIRFAVLKLSQGDMKRFRNAVALANRDWRDLLMAADFANDTKAHNHWIPKRNT